MSPCKPSWLAEAPKLEFVSEKNFLAVQIFEAFVLLGCYAAQSGSSFVDHLATCFV